jgi:hypothetical protein
MDLAAVGLGPYKTASFKPLREQPDSVLRGPENLYQIAATAPEDVDIPAQGFSSSAVCTFAANP